MSVKQLQTIASKTSETLARLLNRSGWLKHQFQKRRSLRILCYHGVCPDELLGEPWVPSYFVSASEFARQIELAQKFAPIVSLPEIIKKIAGQTCDCETAIAITFDDVAACSLAYAAPILERAGITGSFYVSTGNTTTGRLFDTDILRLLRQRPDLIDHKLHQVITPWLENSALIKRTPYNEYREVLNAAETVIQRQLNSTMLDTLRPLNWAETIQLARRGHEIGAHTVDHVVLGSQSSPTRRQQIHDSVNELQRQLGRAVTGFAYPNGGLGDFGPEDIAILRECGVKYSVTTQAGFARGCNLYTLPRICIGGGHTPAKFALELSGLLDSRRRAGQG